MIILFIRSPWGQNIIVNEATKYISDKTNTVVEIDKAFITFKGSLAIDGLYLEDKKGDTLVYSKSLKANLPIWGLIKGTKLGVDNVEWNGLKANIIRKDTVNGYNFQFLIDAFVTPTTKAPTTVQTDTITKSPEIVVGSLNLNNFDIVYTDIPLGIKSSFRIDALETSVETIDVENMVFETEDINLYDAKIEYIQLPVLLQTSEEKVVLPNLFANQINIKNTSLFYEDKVNKLTTNVDLKDFETDALRINLKESIFDINSLALNNSKININLENTQTSTNTSNAEFEWPEIFVNINDIRLENNNFIYAVNNNEIKNKVFNPNAISVSEFNLLANNINYQKKAGSLNVENFNFKESSGLNLEQLKFKANISDTKLSLNNFFFEFDKNNVAGNLKMNYASLSNFIENPENVKVDLNLPTLKLNLNPLLKFQPDFKSNIYIKELSKKPITGKLFANGNLSKINIDNSQINWGSNTNIIVDGTVLKPTNPNDLQLDLPTLKVTTTKTDLSNFVNENELGIHLPENISIAGNVNGGLNDIATKLKLNSSQGTIELQGKYNSKETISFNTEINIEDYKLNELLKNNQLGTLSLNINASGNGDNLNNLDASLKATVTDFTLNNYKIKDVALTGDFKNGVGELTSKYKDDNLNFDLNAFIELDTVNTEAKIDLNIIGADLGGLGLMNRNIKTSMNIDANFNGTSTDYKTDVKVKNGVIVYDNKTYLLGQITANGFTNKDTTAVSVKNKMLNLELESNTDPQSFTTALQQHISSYFYRDVVLTDTIVNPINIKFRSKISQTSLIKDVFLVNLKDIDTIAVALDFNEVKRKLDAKISVPHINYNGSELDSLAFKMNTDKESFNFELGFNGIEANPLRVPQTVITGQQINNQLNLKFVGNDKGKTLMNVGAKITGNRERLVFSVDPENLILNSSPWNIANDNNLVLTDNNLLSFNNFKINKDNQSIEITDKAANIEKTHIAINYKNFKISEVLNYLNPDKQIANGILNGSFILEEPFNDTGIVADLQVDKFKVLKTDLGKFSIDAKSLGGNKYDFKANLKEGDIDLDLIGDYVVVNNDANLNLDVNLNEFKMNALNTLSLGEIKETSGSFNGDFKITGTISNPEYNGNINFNNAEFNVTKLNTKFTLKNEKLTLDNEGLYLSKFTILDAKKNALVLSGKILTESFINPKFDLKLNAKNFRLINADKKDNPSFYGLATFNANADLTGDLQIPKLSANVTLGSDTDVTYVLPSTYASVEHRDDVVVFVNRENPNAILTQTEEKTATITGFDIFTRLKINKDAAITVVIDEETGDNFNVSGEGEFLFNMMPNGRISLTGNYEIADGHYELNLYSLVNRRFDLVPGGRVSWSGDPFEANLDVSAIYNIETSASSLMAAQISDEDASIQNKFKQVLPFYVYLNIDGDLLQPKISFNLDMPEDEQGAVSGQVYGRVQQVNEQEEELNKQVFSLLVLNRFYPDSGSDGSSGGFATIARDNLNDAVSGQLNAFSDKILGNSGIELNFDLNSYTDYQGTTATDRTQLGVTAQKKLFNERLIVRVGSDVDIQGSSQTGEETPLIGNVSLEYKLSEDGRFRLKGFRKSEYENLIDGQTIVNGIALIFTQEFNEFRALWSAIFKAESDRVKKEKRRSEEKISDKEEKTNNSLEKKKN
ncbi:translocation/assembly module TamB domain-containing protein [Polaribacter reichenbachii]|uniref:translocation/assembly module TamB domain-containing protein n=1 Tax=Polaribacter reichenbachii TaxID=996801 RepID=UPI001D001156|nr:translocation/assembly module TamB domain-containing protein [Polaribacter reichenbachii]